MRMRHIVICGLPAPQYFSTSSHKRHDFREKVTKHMLLRAVTLFHSGHAAGGAVVEALRYKPEGRGIDSRCYHWNISFTYSFQPHYSPKVDSGSNRNEYQDYFLRVKAAGA
jgi:hypothetical protein